MLKIKTFLQVVNEIWILTDTHMDAQTHKINYYIHQWWIITRREYISLSIVQILCIIWELLWSLISSHKWGSHRLSPTKSSFLIAIQAHVLRMMRGLFQNGYHEHFILVILYQYLHFMLAYGITCIPCGLTTVFRHLSDSESESFICNN